MDERELLQRWDQYHQRRIWTTVLTRAQTDDGRRVAQRAVDELGDITALDALRANAELVQLLLGRRWYVIQDAREAGATWDEIGEAVGMSRQGAYDWHKRKIAGRERLVPDIHDADRARCSE